MFDFMTGPSWLLRILMWRAQQDPKKALIEAGDRVVTYEEFVSTVEALGRAMLSSGIRKGDRLGIFMANRPEYLMLMFASLRIGAIYVPFSTHYAPDEVHYQLEHIGATVMFVDSERLDVVLGLRGSASALRKIVNVDAGSSQVPDLAAFIASGVGMDLPEMPTADDQALIMYTSGTTDRPKGIVFQHGHLASLTDFLTRTYNWTSEDRALHFFPMYHANGGLVGLLPALASGATIVMLPRFSASHFSQQLCDFRITKANITAPVMSMLLNTPDSPQDSRHLVRVMRQGLTAWPEDILAFEERFNTRLLSNYGLTESLGFVTAFAPHHPPRPGSSGPPLPWVSARIVDDDGKDLPANADGEILIRFDNRYRFSSGYYRDEAKTAELFAGGWLHTGDIGHFDADGYFWFVERKKDMIKPSGFNVAAAEVERAIGTLPGIREVAVVGTPDRIRGEAIVAFVVAVAESKVTTEDVLDSARRQLAPYKVPHAVEWIEQLPRNFVGKVEKRVLRERALKFRIDSKERRSLGR